MRQVFLLSPAQVGGARAAQLLNPSASFALARTFRRQGLPLAEVFTFMSSLYFRGKITYARRFADEKNGDVIRIITSNAGLLAPEKKITPQSLLDFGRTEIDAADSDYHGPLKRHARILALNLDPEDQVILLGSIATGKYRDLLAEVFGDQIYFPVEFAGRGDMSRGGLLLKAAREGQELEYVRVQGANYHRTSTAQTRSRKTAAPSRSPF